MLTNANIKANIRVLQTVARIATLKAVNFTVCLCTQNEHWMLRNVKVKCNVALWKKVEKFIYELLEKEVGKCYNKYVINLSDRQI